jgi:hypothetical protein
MTGFDAADVVGGQPQDRPIQLGPPDGFPRGDKDADTLDGPRIIEAGDEIQGADAPEVVEAGSALDLSPVAVEVGRALDVSPVDVSLEAPLCAWPTPVDAGPGSCRVGRFHLECTYPTGATCDDGTTYTGTGGVRMLCVSEDPTTCPGCHPTSGTVSCESKCSANQYATSCGGPPRLALDGGGTDRGYYQEPPDVCQLATPTPSGMGFYCCPCE